jgi:uncharacterized MAPEG superfamily protein
MTIAFWCVFGAALLPYMCFGITRNGGRERGWDAHLNFFESLPWIVARIVHLGWFDLNKENECFH